MAKSKPSGSFKGESGHSQGVTVQDGSAAGGSGSDSSRKRKSKDRKKKKWSEHNMMRPALNPIQIDTDSDDPECRPPPKKKGKRAQSSPPKAITSEDDFFSRFIKPQGAAPVVDQSPAGKKPPASKVGANMPTVAAERLKPYRETRYAQDLPLVLRYCEKHPNDNEISATGYFAFTGFIRRDKGGWGRNWNVEKNIFSKEFLIDETRSGAGAARMRTTVLAAANKKFPQVNCLSKLPGIHFSAMALMFVYRDEASVER